MYVLPSALALGVHIFIPYRIQVLLTLRVLVPLPLVGPLTLPPVPLPLVTLLGLTLLLISHNLVLNLVLPQLDKLW